MPTGRAARVAKAKVASEAARRAREARARQNPHARLSRSGMVVIKREPFQSDDQQEGEGERASSDESSASSSENEPMQRMSTRSTGNLNEDQEEEAESVRENGHGVRNEGTKEPFVGISPADFYSKPARFYSQSNRRQSDRSVASQQQQQPPSKGTNSKASTSATTPQRTISTRSSLQGTTTPNQAIVKEEIVQGEVNVTAAGPVTRRRASTIGAQTSRPTSEERPESEQEPKARNPVGRPPKASKEPSAENSTLHSEIEKSSRISTRASKGKSTEKINQPIKTEPESEQEASSVKKLTTSIELNNAGGSEASQVDAASRITRSRTSKGGKPADSTIEPQSNESDSEEESSEAEFEVVFERPATRSQSQGGKTTKSEAPPQKVQDSDSEPTAEETAQSSSSTGITTRRQARQSSLSSSSSKATNSSTSATNGQLSLPVKSAAKSMPLPSDDEFMSPTTSNGQMEGDVDKAAGPSTQPSMAADDIDEDESSTSSSCATSSANQASANDADNESSSSAMQSSTSSNGFHKLRKITFTEDINTPYSMLQSDEPGTSGEGTSTSQEATRMQPPRSTKFIRQNAPHGPVPKKAAKPKSAIKTEDDAEAENGRLTTHQAVYFWHQRQQAPKPNPFRYKTELNGFAKSPNKDCFYVAFNNWIAGSGHDIFAVAGDQRVTVFECNASSEDKTKTSAFKALLSFVDEEDVFYSCAWSYGIHKGETKHYVLAGGKKGILRVFFVNSPAFGGLALRGHGEAINEIIVDPKNPNLFFTASSDWTIRMWNTRSWHLVAVFGGWGGHRDQVLSCDVHLSMDLFASTGVDRQVLLWRYDNKAIKKSIAETNEVRNPNKSYRPPVIHLPCWETDHVHSHYIDSIRWMGDYLLTRSCDKDLKLWKPSNEDLNPSISLTELTKGFVNRDETRRTVINKKKHLLVYHFEMDTAEMFYIRMALHQSGGMLAVGEDDGDIFLWDTKCKLVEINHQILEAPYTSEYGRCRTPVRHVAFNPAGNILVGVQDGGYISMWSISPRDPNEPAQRGRGYRRKRR